MSYSFAVADEGRCVARRNRAFARWSRVQIRPLTRVRRRREATLALRVFTDRDGYEWQVWNVEVSSGQMGVRVDLRQGWLCFERVKGGDRCRLALAEAPPAWEQLPDEVLDRLRRAAAVRRSSRAVMRDTGEHQRVDEETARRRRSGPRHVVGDDDES
jgi:hypothetical protein